MKLLKYAAWSVGVLLALAMLAGVGLWFYFDPNDFKDEVQNQVREQTGRELALPGRISLSLFPDIALEFGPAMLGDAAGFGNDPMLQVERVRLGVKLRPLFSKHVEVSSIEVIRPVVRLQTDAGGRNNWSDIGDRMRQRPQEPAGNGSAPLMVQIASLTVDDGRLDYADARDASIIALNGLKVSTGELAAGKPVRLDMSFNYSKSPANQPAAPALSATVRISSVLSLDLEQERYRLESPDIELLARGANLPTEGLPVTLRSPSLDLDLQQQTLDWPGLQVDIAGAKLNVELKGSGISEQPQLGGTLTMAELSPRDWLPRLGIALPATADAAVFRRLALRGGFTANATSVSLGNLDVQLDESRLTGSATIADLKGMAVQFELQVDRFNGDRYMQPAPASVGTAAVAKKKAAPVQIPVDLLRALNVRGSLRVAQATFAGVQFSGLRVAVTAARGKARLAPLEAGLYGGHYKGDIAVDATTTPRISFNEQISDVDFAPLAKDWLETNKLSGRGNLSVKAVASGSDSDALLRTLAGSMAVKVDNGAIEGIDLLYEIRRAHALLKKQEIPARAGPARTAFNQLSATANIVDGILTSNDLVAATQVLRVDGKGSTNLPAGQIDMRLDVSVLKSVQGEAAPELADAAGLVIPVRVAGALSDPAIRPDVGAIARALLQHQYDDKKQELEKKLRDQLDDKLKSLFGR